MTYTVRNAAETVALPASTLPLTVGAPVEASTMSDPDPCRHDGCPSPSSLARVDGVPRLEAWWFEADDETVERMRAAVAGRVSEYWAQLVIPPAVVEPLPMMSWAEMLELMRQATPPDRVLIVAPERVEAVQAALDAARAREGDWAMLAELNAIEVRGAEWFRETDWGWLVDQPKWDEKVRIW